VSQNTGGALTRACAWLASRGFKTSMQAAKRCRFVRIGGGRYESLRFLMLTRPERLIAKLRTKIAAGRVSLYGRDHRVVALVKKEYVGVVPVLAIETDSHTFIAEGLASHNCNFWRALAADPDAVADAANWPVNENDQHARHIWLVNQRATLTAKLEGDPDYFDVKIAGWWVWGICCWIAGGWCSGKGPWQSVDGQMTDVGADGIAKRQRVHLGAGQGVHRKLVHLGDAGRGVHRQLVHLGDAGQGEWFAALAARLRHVRVCCGDWERVCGPTPTVKQGLTGVLLDPPYGDDADRDTGCYAVDSGTVAADVRAWAIAHGDDPLLRIALCGYDTEHAMLDSWTAVPWKAAGGYGSQGDGRGRENAARETIWFSRHCLRPADGLPFDT